MNTKMHYEVPTIDGKGKIKLTHRQMQVLVLTAKGKTKKEISQALMIGEKTTNKHMQDVHTKFWYGQYRNRTDVTAYAIAIGLIENPFSHLPKIEYPLTHLFE